MLRDGSGGGALLHDDPAATLSSTIIAAVPSMSSFDTIIVGAGSAGCVLAARLSEDGARTVALVEAGGPPKRREIHIPAAFSKLFRTQCDWAYTTEAQPELGGRQLFWPRGRVVGGSSSINAMIHTRGNPHDYDSWSREGAAGWSFEDVLPFFRKLEGRDGAGGERGPLDVRSLVSPNPLSRAFLTACEEEGIAPNGDFDGARQEGAGFFRVNQRGGRRFSCAAAYLKPALGRPNLTLFTETLTTRVLIEGGRARGVEVLERGRHPRTLVAEREVILCGGAVNSPQILMLSGIGPAEELRSAGIAPVVDSPEVGRNLQDHLAAGVAHACTRPVTLAAAETLGSLLQFLFLRRGMLTSNVAEAGAFVRSRPGLPSPDVELIFGPAYFVSHGFANPAGHGFTVGAILLHPQSRGTVRLRSTNPLDPPRIQPEYLRERADWTPMLDGLRLARRIARARAFDAFRGDEVLPGPQVQSDEDLAAFVRRTAETLYHPVGTCRMGSDAMAVVDPELRVRGVDGLRVVDASVMPSIISGHTNGPVVMIAEKAAEMIQRGQSQPRVPAVMPA